MGNVSEKDSVYSTDDEVVRPVVKRKKKANTIASSSNSDEDSDIEIRPKIIGKRQKCKSEDDAGGLNEVEINKNSSDALNNQSDSEQVEKCAICLSKFLGQDIATPEACDHVFCLECLQEWAKNVNTCPIDRLKFNLILIRHHKEEKVIKTIVVNNSELPYSSDAETESSAQYQIAFCDFCTEEGLADCFVRCFHCRKFYHYYCLISRSSSNSLPWQCPTCENDVSLSSELLMRHRPQLLRSPFRNRRRRGYIQTTDLLIRQRFHCEAALNRSLLSTSESSEEDTTDNSPISSRLYRNPAISSISNSDSPLLKKRRNAICHPRSRALVSSAVSATSGTRSLFEEDSGDEYEDLRFSSTSVPENYDLVGSILQSQTLLHAPDVLTLTRDGSLLRNNSKQENSPRRFSMNTSPMQNSGESNQSSLPDSSFFSDGTVSPYNGDVVVKQRPLNPTQNNNSKYGETPKQAHSSASSGSSMERSLSYNDNSVTRLPLGSSNTDHYSNDPCSPIGQKNYCSSSAAEDPKKDRPSKNQHSEDEVDIYSDIESVGEEDGSLSDRVEPLKISFKCEDSQLSNPNEASDSSDNDLVIDEDMHVEDEDKAKDGQEPYSSSKHKSSQNKNSVPHCESEESNASSNAGSDEEQLTIEETNSGNPRPSFIDNSSDNCYNPTEESPARFQNDDSNVSKLSAENETAPKNESDSDANQQESDVDMQEYEENSQDSAKKSFQADTNTPCTSVKSSPKSCRGETLDGFEIQCDNSVSNENSVCGENSGFEQEEFKEVYEEASNQENTCDSVSQGGENENLAIENNSNLSEATSQVEGNDNFQNEQNSNLSSGSDQRNADASEPEDFADSNLTPVRGSSPSKEKSANTSNDVSMKSDEEDNLDSIENASTPCLDENQDGMLENSPVEDNYEDTGPDFEASPQNNAEIGKEDDLTANEEITCEKMECDPPSTVKIADKDSHDNTVDLGIEDISDAGSEDLRDEFTDEVSTSERAKKETSKQKVASPFSPDHSETAEEEKTDDCFQQVSEEVNKSLSNQSFEDHEEGEIIEERPHRCNRRKKERLREEANYTEYNPRVNISDLPRIPKLKRDKDKENVSEVITFENKRTSVLSRVDLGNSADISWKRLSKHTRERSYRDGRPKDERLLYRERESRNKDKNSGESSRRTEKNSEHRREEKKQEVEKSKKDYDSRSRKTEKNKSDDWNYSEREKRKSRKDKHSKDKHSKDKKEKDKHDKTKYSKDESKYEREKTKEDSRYERDSRYDKEERFERTVYEKDKFKEKEHKSKHKDRKGDSKSSKDHSREKHKHSHSSSDHFSDKQREREVRKIDDKIKIVVEQKDSRKDKSKHKEKKESKHDKKVTPRKVENERIPYTESTSIESKEIFAKGDSIIINVNFNRASSPKNNLTVKGPEPISKDRKVATEELDKEDQVSPEEVKCKPKHSNTDKGKSSHEAVATKRPTSPPKNPPVLSVSESYWQGGDDPDDNSRSSSKSIVEIRIDDDSDEESPNAFEANNLSNGGSSLDPAPTVLKDTNSNTEEPASAPEKEATSNFPKEPESFPSKRRSPRSPSPPSPADNDSYDPCEPTKSPSPPPMPPAPPLPTINPKPPPSPELPPLPPEPEPMDNEPIKPPEFVSVPAVMVCNSAQPVTVHTQTSMASPLPMQSMMLPPPSFLSQVSSAASMPNMIVPPRSGSFQMSGHPVLLPSNHVPQVMGGSFVPPPMHGNTTLPPPPNPPNMPHMSSVPPPPPPPAGITLLPQVRHPHLSIHPPMNPTSLLQSLAMGHSHVAPPLQLVHQLPPNLSGILANQAQMVRNAQNQLASLPVSMANPQGSRMVLSQNPMLNHSALFQNQNMNDCNKSQGNLLPPHTQIMPGGSGLQLQMSEKLPKTSPPPSADKNEVVDMDVDTPYSPACSPSVDSVGDYSPTCSPIPSSPKSKDIFDSLLPTEPRTSEKRTHDVAGSEKSKQHSSKKSKHEHKSDSKSRHSVRLQTVKDKHKKSRKEHKQTDRRESGNKLEDTQLKILDELPSSAVEMQVKEKFLKKLNRQERVVEEVKFVLKPYYKSRDVTKEEYKDILRKSVPKICHNKSGEINPVKVKYLVECYVKKAKHSRKKGEKKKSTLS